MNGVTQLQVVDQRQIEAPAVQTVHQFMLFAVVELESDFGIHFFKSRHQFWHIQRRDGFKAADGNSPGYQLFIRPRVLLKLIGQPQQLFSFIVEAPPA